MAARGAGSLRFAEDGRTPARRDLQHRALALRRLGPLLQRSELARSQILPLPQARRCSPLVRPPSPRALRGEPLRPRKDDGARPPERRAGCRGGSTACGTGRPARRSADARRRRDRGCRARRAPRRASPRRARPPAARRRPAGTARARPRRGGARRRASPSGLSGAACGWMSAARRAQHDDSRRRQAPRGLGSARTRAHRGSRAPPVSALASPTPAPGAPPPVHATADDSAPRATGTARTTNRPARTPANRAAPLEESLRTGRGP